MGKKGLFVADNAQFVFDTAFNGFEQYTRQSAVSEPAKIRDTQRISDFHAVVPKDEPIPLLFDRESSVVLNASLLHHGGPPLRLLTYECAKFSRCRGRGE